MDVGIASGSRDVSRSGRRRKSAPRCRCGAALAGVWLLGLLLPLSGPPAATAQATPRAVDLNLKFRQGETSRYRLTVQVDAAVPALGTQAGASAYNVNLDLIALEKVVRQLPNGGELAISTVSGKGNTNGTPFTPVANTRPALIAYTTRGDLISARDLPAANPGMPMLSNMFGSGAMSMNGVFLPDHAVSIGDTWSKKVKIAGLTGNLVATVKATYVANEEVGHYRAAKIHSTLTAPLRALIDATGQPALRQSSAVGELTGVFNMTYDTDLAIEEGKVVRAAGNGSVSVLIQPWDRAGVPPANSGAAKPAQAPKVHSTPSASDLSSATRMVMKLRMGNILIQ